MESPQLNVHQLYIFHAVATHHSFSRAAEVLYLSQPGVSLQVKSLERSIGMPLFEKAGRSMRLTHAGEELFAYSERIFALLDETQMVMQELHGARRGAIKVAASTTAGIYVVPAALGAFHRQNPAIKLTLDVVNRFTVQEQLVNNEIDLAVMVLIEDAHDLEVATFVANQLVVIAPPGHPLVRRRQIPLADLAGELFLLREKGSGTRTDVEHIFERAEVDLKVGMELRSSGAIKQAVAADLGISVIPHSAIELELITERLVILDVVGFPINRHWSLARRKGRHLSAAAYALWRFLLAYRDEAARVASM